MALRQRLSVGVAFIVAAPALYILALPLKKYILAYSFSLAPLPTPKARLEDAAGQTSTSPVKLSSSETQGAKKSNLLEGETSTLPASPSKEVFDSASFLNGCTQVYLDMGSNIGIQVRKLFEPNHYPHAAQMLALFDKAFGPPERRARRFAESGLCAVGFEANPQHQQRLQALESSYTNMGWRVHFFVPLAVANDDKNVTFWANGQRNMQSWGASMFRDRAIMPRYGQRKTTVNSLDITAWILKYLRNRTMSPTSDAKPYVLAKMDIEGAEYLVLPRMMDKGVLCENTIDEMFLEWHRAGRGDKASKEALNKRVLDEHRCLPKGITKKQQIDDETYLLDRLPLPDARQETAR